MRWIELRSVGLGLLPMVSIKEGLCLWERLLAISSPIANKIDDRKRSEKNRMSIPLELEFWYFVGAKWLTGRNGNLQSQLVVVVVLRFSPHWV